MKDSRDNKTPLIEGTGRVDEMLERALVDKVCLWSYRVTFYLVAIAAIMLYVSGQDNWVNPAAVGVFSFLSGQYLDGPQHITLTLIFSGSQLRNIPCSKTARHLGVGPCQGQGARQGFLVVIYAL